MLPGYAELHCLSNFTFLRGASHPEELVARAAVLGYGALAITDECSLAGVVRAHEEAKRCALKLLIGSEIRFSLDGGKRRNQADTAQLRLVLLAMNRAGYGQLADLISRGRRATKKGEYHLSVADLGTGLTNCLALLLPSPHTDIANIQLLAERFPHRLWIAAELLAGANDAAYLERLQRLAQTTAVPLTAAGDVHMHVRARRALQDTLTTVRLGVPVKEAGFALHPNGERHLRPIARLAKLYPPALLAETLNIAARCAFSLDELRYEYPEELTPPGETPAAYLRRLALRGLQWRFPNGAPAHVVRLVEHELTLIAELRYEPYFLTVYDIVQFARSRNILCQGRGSAANSVVCYCLGITEVDPERMSVLFERFISKERNEPPDIDVDFEHERREEVIQYLYQKYSRERAALTAAVITYRPKSALRDVGKALGFSLDQVDQLAKSTAWWDGRKVSEERLQEVGFDPAHKIVQRLMLLVNELVGFPRHLSQHTGGFVISRGPLSQLVPIENAAMPERTVIQWDKDDLDALGLLKVDVLALGMLTAIRKTLDLIGRWRRRPMALSDIPPEDPKVYDMIDHADTIGVFQIESRAQMSMLPRLKPRNYYDLVIEVAIVRPGPIQGGMVHPYLRRRQGLDPVIYPSEAVEQVLKRTLGVPIFQEQVMQLAVVAAGFTPGEADQLRRSMAAWRRKGGLEPFEKRLKDGMRERGYPEEFADQIYRQILGFGEYGFPESHSASFALLVYTSSWLKYYAPAAFAAALLNSQPMGFYAPAQIVQDAKRHGVPVRAVDVCASDWDCTLEAQDDNSEPAIRLGLRMVKGLSQAGAQRIVEARTTAAFADADDLARRAELNRHDLTCLANADALANLAGHRRNAAWQVAGIEIMPPIFQNARIVEVPALLSAPSEGQNIVADYASVGLTLGRHPLALLRDRLRQRRILSAEQLKLLRHGRFARAAGLVTNRQHPATAKGTIFVTLEDETGYVNVVVWGDLAERQRTELLCANLMGVAGVLEREGEVVHLIARRLFDYNELLGKLTTRSRDFR